ncbi:hypothetical protein JCM6882_001879 [Rhodosporidiobolus microsporus]
MSGRSPKALLPSSLSLSSISRALPSHKPSSAHYPLRTLSLASLPAKPQGQPSPATGGLVAVRQHRRATTQANAPGAGPSGAGTAAPPAAAAGRAGGAGQQGGASESKALLRSASVGHGGAAGGGRTAFSSPGAYFDQSSNSSSAVAARQFHTSARSSHQQAVSPSSGGVVPPPPHQSAPPASGPAGASSPKHHSSLATPSSSSPADGGDPAILLGSNPYGQSSGSSSSSSSSSSGGSGSSSSSSASSSQALIHGPSAPTASTSSHPSSASTSSITTSPPSSAPAPPHASLFASHPPPHSPAHAPLPSFFGNALSIARRSNLVFRNGAYGIPKPKFGQSASKKGKEKMLLEREDEEHFLSVGVGEDAYFLRSDSLGVADGVGGWSGHAGANSARWARKFMHHCSAELARYENIEDDLFLQYYEVDPVDVMQRGFEKTLAECKEEGTIGSSTALLALLRNDELRLANLGDCACCVIRGSSYIFRSEEQQHQFNFPYQAGTNAKDTPAKDAQRFTVKVKRDDIVILSSDGLVDNVFSDDLLEEVLRFVGTNPPLSTSTSTLSSRPSSPSSSSNPSSNPSAPQSQTTFTLRRFSPQAVSEALCFRAKSVYDDQRAVASPFQQRAMEEGIHYAGGKIDDVSCLVAVVGEQEAAPNRRDVS